MRPLKNIVPNRALRASRLVVFAAALGALAGCSPFSRYLQACEGGNGLACTQAGYSLERGRDVPADPVRAHGLYEQACAMKDAFGCRKAAAAYRCGGAVPRDPARELAQLERGCAGGDAEACLRFAVSAALQDDPGLVERGAVWLEGACGEASVAACIPAVELLTLRSVGAAEHSTAWVQLLGATCEAKSALACAALADLHGSGMNAVEDPLIAFELRSRACEYAPETACALPPEPADAPAGLTDAELARTVRRHWPAVKACYDRELDCRNSLGGRLVLELELRSDGRVKNALLSSTSLNSKVVEECIVAEARRWRFPSPRGGAPVHASYPFAFLRNVPTP